MKRAGLSILAAGLAACALFVPAIRARVASGLILAGVALLEIDGPGMTDAQCQRGAERLYREIERERARIARELRAAGRSRPGSASANGCRDPRP